MDNYAGEILIIDDSVENIKILINLLKDQYAIHFATDGLKGIELPKEKKPDVILLDVMMEPINGYEVCKELKALPLTAHIPVVFLTAAAESLSETKGFEVGGSDYLTKPFVPVVMLARIQNHIRLSQYMREMKRLYSLALDANPITQLPGNNSINRYINQLIENQENKCVFYLDLDNFKAFNDKYGFSRGDNVIAKTAQVFKSVAKNMDIDDFFFGHIGGDDFVISVDSDIGIQFIGKLIIAFDFQIPNYYDEQDLKNGFIHAKNRRDEYVDYPIMSLSVVGVDLSKFTYSNALELSDAFAAMKHIVKAKKGSNLMMDRRKA